MSTRPAAAVTEYVARQILFDARNAVGFGGDVATYLAKQLAEELRDRGGWKANTCKPLLRAYEMAAPAADSSGPGLPGGKTE